MEKLEQFISDCFSGVAGKKVAGWKSAVAAALLTAGMFLVLPFLEILSEPTPDMIPLRDVDTVIINVSTPMPERAEEPPPDQEPARPLPSPPVPAQPSPAPPERMSVPFKMDIGVIAGDFDAGFGAIGTDFAGGPETYAFDMLDLDEAPVPIAQFPPMYPPVARMRKIEGSVRIEFVINREGFVENPVIIEGEHIDIFGKPALAAVRRWRFKPGIKSGKPVRVRVRQSFRFVLED